jgi:uncharacterized protein YdeI (YjbR/CyaY-like superfamily)
LAGPAASPVPGPERPLSGPETAERLHPDTRAEWRAWLAEHHDASKGVWLLFWRKQSGRMGLSYEEAVQEALCFGWIDSKGAKLDDHRTMLWMSPRKRGSGWARTNKARIEQLLGDGLMAPAGLAMIEEAKRDGSWTLLDDVENLVVPDDLGAALDANPGARERWDALSRSVRRAALEQIVLAKRPETRARRVAETARLTAEGERPGPGEWRPRS